MAQRNRHTSENIILIHFADLNYGKALPYVEEK